MTLTKMWGRALKKRRGNKKHVTQTLGEEVDAPKSKFVPILGNVVSSALNIYIPDY